MRLIIVICGLSDYNFFPSYLKIDTIFGKTFQNMKLVLIFSTTFVGNIVKISTIIFISNTGRWTQLKLNISKYDITHSDYYRNFCSKYGTKSL